MTRVGPSICGTMVPKDVCDLQLWAGQPSRPLLQPSPDGMILQLLQHLVWADSTTDGLGRDMRIARCCAELGMTQQHLDHPNIGSCLAAGALRSCGAGCAAWRAC